MESKLVAVRNQYGKVRTITTVPLMQTCRSLKLLSLSSAHLIVFEFQRRSNSKRMSWVCAQIFESRLFFFCNNKKGSVSPIDISDLFPEKREGEFTTKKWGRVGIQRAFWAEKLSWAAFILFYFWTVQTQFFWVKRNSKNWVWVGFHSKFKCARGKSGCVFPKSIH